MSIKAHLINFPEGLRDTLVMDLQPFTELDISISTFNTQTDPFDSMALIYLDTLKWKEELRQIIDWKKNHQIQLLVVSKSENIPVGIASLKAGAFDYIVWNNKSSGNLRMAVQSFLQVVKTKKKLQEYSILLSRFKRIGWTLPLILLLGLLVWIVFR